MIALACVACIFYPAIGNITPLFRHNGVNITKFGLLMVQSEGRIKPIAAVSRNEIRAVTGRSTIRVHNHVIGPEIWLLTVLSQPNITDKWPIFDCKDKEIRVFMDLPSTGNRWVSITELKPHLRELWQQAVIADQGAESAKSPFDRKLIQLKDQIWRYYSLKNTIKSEQISQLGPILEIFSGGGGGILASQSRDKISPELTQLRRLQQQLSMSDQLAAFQIASGPDTQFNTVAKTILELKNQNSPQYQRAYEYAQLIDAAAVSNWGAVNQVIDSIYKSTYTHDPATKLRMWTESIFRITEPFDATMAIYGIALALFIISGRIAARTHQAAASAAVHIGWVYHTVALLIRMVIDGRPPVTNLYSSAVFVGWVSVGIGLVVWHRYRRRIGLLTGSIIGFLTLLVAHGLGSLGETMMPMQAVLDSNFWLSTHVVTITLGYGATLFAGTIGCFHILQGIFGTAPDTNRQQRDTFLIGIVRFATATCIIGTILGGIWADQSWGRFWGWDPKENGALLIVLWNAVILHCHLAGWLKRRGRVAVMAVVGNIVTAFSWFGVNLLGVGLHSYGFTTAGFFFLMLFSIIHTAIISVGLLPERFWKNE